MGRLSALPHAVRKSQQPEPPAAETLSAHICKRPLAPEACSHCTWGASVAATAELAVEDLDDPEREGDDEAPLSALDPPEPAARDAWCSTSW
eukprot:362744-Heterocapsa_arctica.AAC.1